MSRRAGRRGAVRGLALAAPLLAALVLALPWLWAERRLRAGLDDWEASRTAEGWTVHHAAPVRAGWPFEAALELADVTLSVPDAALPGGLDWHAAGLRLGVALLHPGTLRLAPLGPQRLRAGPLPELALAAARLEAAVALGGPAPVPVLAEDLAVGLPGAPPLRVARLALTVAPGPDAAPLAATLDATGLVLPPGLPAPLGPEVAALSGTARLLGALPPARPGGSPAAAAIAWRDAGGRLALSGVRAQWGPLRLAGGAELLLDGLLQPAGTATVRLAGWSEALDAMVAAGSVPQGAAVAARAVLGLLARTPADGGPPEVTLPLVLGDRTLSAGHIPLLRLPPLAWTGVP